MSDVDLSDEFSLKCLQETVPVCVFGVVPPPETVPMEKRNQLVDSVGAALARLALDAFVVYDVQNEAGRDGSERPFPYTPAHDNRAFCADVRDAIRRAASASGAAVPTPILYRAMCARPKADVPAWLAATHSEPLAIRHLVLVGHSAANSSADSFASLAEATAVVRGGAERFALGGVTLPERHGAKRDEHVRLLGKHTAQTAFFISQVVYSADLAVMLLRDYAAECRARGHAPRRIVLCFSPFSRVSVVRLLRWLGCEVPAGTEARVLSAPQPGDECVELIVEIFRRVLETARRRRFGVPIGFLVESISRFKDDADAAHRLVPLLRAELQHHCDELQRQRSAE
jgi:hypothetical protein